jgi:hypothetical protein
LPTRQPSSAEGTVLSYYGYRFEVPWKDLDKESNDGRWVRVGFKTGQTLEFFNPAFFQDNPISGPVSVNLKEAFGPVMRQSKYQQLEAMLSITPSQWSPFRSRKEFARVLGLLEIKGLWFEHNVAEPEVFSFETSDYQGIEISGLSHDWQDVRLNLFDATDHWFQIVFLAPPALV